MFLGVTVDCQGNTQTFTAPIPLFEVNVAQINQFLSSVVTPQTGLTFGYSYNPNMAQQVNFWGTEVVGCTVTMNFTDGSFPLGNCVPEASAVLGCTDPTADNYNASANIEDGSCTYTPQAAFCIQTDIFVDETLFDSVFGAGSVIGDDGIYKYHVLVSTDTLANLQTLFLTNFGTTGGVTAGPCGFTPFNTADFSCKYSQVDFEVTPVVYPVLANTMKLVWGSGGTPSNPTQMENQTELLIWLNAQGVGSFAFDLVNMYYWTTADPDGACGFLLSH